MKVLAVCARGGGGVLVYVRHGVEGGFICLGVDNCSFTVYIMFVFKDDQGTPMMCLGDNHHWYLAGMFTWTLGNCGNNTSLYLSLPYYLDFLHEFITADTNGNL